MSTPNAGLLEACRQRIAELDEQIAPLAAYEDMRDAHAERAASSPRPHAVARQVDGPTRDFPYSSPGGFIVDYLRARGIMERNVRDDERGGPCRVPMRPARTKRRPTRPDYCLHPSSAASSI